MKTHSPPFTLLALPPLQRKLMAYLIREGATDQATLAQTLALDPADVQVALRALQANGRIQLTAPGMYAAHLGRTRPRTLPARLWPALQTASRLYSSQEIITLRTAIPIVQFARAKLGEFTDHGPGHVLRVKAFATQLAHLLGLTASEHRLLRAAALFHDVGNIIDRATHHLVSQETVEKLAATGQIPFSHSEAALVGLLCRWHRKAYDPDRLDQLHGETIRTGLAASILRVADALDSDYRRVDYGAKFKRVLQLFYPHELPYLDDLATILGIRIHCTPAIQLQVFVQSQTQVEASYHIGALRKDVAETPLPCTVQVIKCGAQRAPQNAECGIAYDSHSALRPPPSALLACPFDPHSLIMAALSRKHLLAAGYRVELLVYPDAPEATAWLWREALTDFTPSDFAQLVVIGDRPDAASTPPLLARLADWQQGGVQCTLLNRHEANWARLPDLMHIGVQVSLGGDWAYFWGDGVDESDLFWGRIAALCTRDPIQATVGLTGEEEQVSQGLLKAIYDAVARMGRDGARTSEGWDTLAIPILERISGDERSWFAAQAAAFNTTYAMLPIAPVVQGKVLQFDLATTQQGHTVFWGLERAIEAAGRAAERGIAFTTPYALAMWVDPTDDAAGEMVQLLAINHWREQEATPIRLLYPADLGPAPEGNESALRVRLPAAQARQVVQALLAACNEV